MEPNTTPGKPQQNTQSNQTDTSAVDSLRSEGIDIVQGSGVSEENEFSTGDEQIREEKPSLTKESATLIASLQEMPQSFTPAPKIPTPPSPTVEPKPIEEKHPLNDPSIKQIRTFKSDAEEAVKYQNVSAVDIALAEQKKREKMTAIQYETPKESHTGLFIILTVILVLGLGGGWYFWFSSSQSPEIKKAPTVSIRTIIPYTKGSTLTIDSESDPLGLIASKLLVLNAGLGNIYAVLPVPQVGASEQIELATVLRNTAIPNRLLRSLSNTYMIGAYTYDTQSPFLILKNTFFQNAFSGMLEWEKDMGTDLLPLIQVSYPEETKTSVALGTFEDLTLSNTDVRILKNEQGKAILMYAFADKDTMIITTSENTLTFLLNRLLTVRTIQ